MLFKSKNARIIEELNLKISILESRNKTLESQNTTLVVQKRQLYDEVCHLQREIEAQRSIKEKDKTKNSNSNCTYSSYQKGYFSKPKPFFDSPAESELEYALDELLSKLQLYKIGIRLLAHQPIGNYVKEIDIKQVNIRNKSMHFDFLLEIRKDFNVFFPQNKNLYRFSSKEGHIPLLAIELDGKSHSDAEQIERDKYKNGVCKGLKISMLRIPYASNYFYNKDIDNQEFYQNRLNNYIDETYRNEIIQKLFLALFDQIPSTKLAWCKCYSMEQLPEIADLIEQTYDEFYEKQENETSRYFD